MKKISKHLVGLVFVFVLIVLGVTGCTSPGVDNTSAVPWNSGQGFQTENGWLFQPSDWQH
jgi:hypothetical protein